MIGLCLCGLGANFSVLAGLGTDPWTVFHMGISNHLPLTIGQATQVFGLLFIILGLFLGTKPGIGTILNMYFYGYFYDLWDRVGVFPLPSSPCKQYFYLLLGVVILGAGLAIYITAGLGAGPRDGVVLGLRRRLGLSIRLAKSSMEVAALTIGYFIGGIAGIGTLIFALAIGPVLQYALKVCDHFIAPVLTPKAKVIAQAVDDT